MVPIPFFRPQRVVNHLDLFPILLPVDPQADVAAVQGRWDGEQADAELLGMRVQIIRHSLPVDRAGRLGVGPANRVGRAPFGERAQRREDRRLARPRAIADVVARGMGVRGRDQPIDQQRVDKRIVGTDADHRLGLVRRHHGGKPRQRVGLGPDHQLQVGGSCWQSSRSTGVSPTRTRIPSSRWQSEVRRTTHSNSVLPPNLRPTRSRLGKATWHA